MEPMVVIHQSSIWVTQLHKVCTIAQLCVTTLDGLNLAKPTDIAIFEVSKSDLDCDVRPFIIPPYVCTHLFPMWATNTPFKVVITENPLEDSANWKELVITLRALVRWIETANVSNNPWPEPQNPRLLGQYQRWVLGAELAISALA